MKWTKPKVRKYSKNEKQNLKINLEAKAYPFNIVHVKMPIQRELLDPVWKISLETCNDLPTIALQINVLRPMMILEQNIQPKNKTS